MAMVSASKEADSACFLFGYQPKMPDKLKKIKIYGILKIRKFNAFYFCKNEFSNDLDYKINEFFEDGKDQVEIFIKTNVGENENELTKIASGGEMSRIMLAIKTAIVTAAVDTAEVCP